MKTQSALIALALLLVCSAPAEAGWLDRLLHRRSRSENRLARAGKPHLTAPWSKCTYGRKYCGYFVGGGAVFTRNDANRIKGESRYAEEGTWGMDYSPWYSRVSLGWYHGRRFQGGTGQYEPDGKNFPLSKLFGR